MLMLTARVVSAMCAMWALPMPVVTKFDKKQHVLDAPAKAKKWTLINNYGDKTLMRNLRAFELSKRLGYTYRPNAIADVTIDMAQPYLVFTLEGLPCGTTLEGLRPGIYVVRQGLLSRKVIVR